MNSLKNEYNGIKASDELRERIEKIMVEKKTVRKNPLQAVVACVACAALICVAAVNMFPTLAYAASDIPVVGDIVRVITFGRYEFYDGGYQADIKIPKIEGLVNRELEGKVNTALREDAERVIKQFEEDVAEFKKIDGDAGFFWGVDSDYEVKTDNEDYLVLDVMYTHSAATGTTVHRFYNIDKKNGEILTLQSLFRDGTDYITPISEFIREDMKSRHGKNDEFFWLEEPGPDAFEKIREDQKFYINSEGNIIISFEKYEVAPGASGNPEFEIPVEVVADIRK